jgi:uncharacterized membrane protein SirB2
MNPAYYYVLHVFSLLVLTAHTYMALANPDPAGRKQTLIITGVASLLMLVSGFGLVARVHQGHMEPWVFVKLACWLGFSALAGLAYRKAHLRGVLSVAGLGCLLVALWTVYVGRF